MLSLAEGAVNTSLDVQIVDDEGLPVTGLVASTFPTVKFSKGIGADVTISLSDLSALTDAHADGGVKERGEGVYRLDVPDTVASTTAIVRLRGEASGKRLICPPIQVGLQDALEDALGDAVDDLEVAPPVSLTVGQVLPRVWSQDIEAFVGEEATHTLIAVNNRGVAQDLSGIASLSVVIATKASNSVIQTIANGDLDRTDDADGIIRFTNSADVTESVRTLRYVLKNASGNVRVMRGDFKVSYEP